MHPFLRFFFGVLAYFATIAILAYIGYWIDEHFE